MKTTEKKTKLVLELSISLDSATEWNRAENSLSAFIPRLLITVCGMYRGTKSKPEQRIKASSCSLYSDKKIQGFFFFRSSAAANKIFKKITILWSEVEFKVNSRSHKPHLFTLCYFKERYDTWAGLLQVWCISFAEAACWMDGWMDGVSGVFRTSCDHRRTTRLCSGPTASGTVFLDGKTCPFSGGRER